MDRDAVTPDEKRLIRLSHTILLTHKEDLLLLVSGHDAAEQDIKGRITDARHGNIDNLTDVAEYKKHVDKSDYQQLCKAIIADKAPRNQLQAIEQFKYLCQYIITCYAKNYPVSIAGITNAAKQIFGLELTPEMSYFLASLCVSGTDISKIRYVTALLKFMKDYLEPTPDNSDTANWLSLTDNADNTHIFNLLGGVRNIEFSKMLLLIYVALI